MDLVDCLIVGLGDSLSTLMKAEHCRELSELCPDAQIDVRRGAVENVSTDCMIALGKRASFLFVEEDEETIANLGNIGRACPNLTEILCSADFIPMSAFQDFFEAPKLNLLKVTVYSFEETPMLDSDSMFQVLGEKVSTLEEFESVGPVPPLHLLPQFVAANRNLKEVELRLTFPLGTTCLCFPADTPYVSDASILNGKRARASILTAFLKSGSLVLLDCACSTPEGNRFPDFADICIPARYKSASIGMCGYQYF